MAVEVIFDGNDNPTLLRIEGQFSVAVVTEALRLAERTPVKARKGERISAGVMQRLAFKGLLDDIERQLERGPQS